MAIYVFIWSAQSWWPGAYSLFYSSAAIGIGSGSSSLFHLTSSVLHLLSCSQIWFSVNAIDSSVSSRFFGVSSHSHTVMQCQPIAASLRCSSLSRSLFLRIFATQNSRFVFGILQHSLLSMFNVSSLMFNVTFSSIWGPNSFYFSDYCHPFVQPACQGRRTAKQATIVL